MDSAGLRLPLVNEKGPDLRPENGGGAVSISKPGSRWRVVRIVQSLTMSGGWPSPARIEDPSAPECTWETRGAALSPITHFRRNLLINILFK
jgi:hypothetical protein